MAQDGITWDPVETGQMTWRGMLGVFAVVAACYGIWRLFLWLLERRRDRIPWNVIRLWWPTVMVAAGLLILALPSNLVERSLAVFAAVNLPALVVTGLVLGLVEDAPVSIRISVGSVTMWAASYAFIRFLEWRAFLRAPVRLDLTPPSPRHPPRSSGP
jgi:hypothetical protein